MKSIYRIGLIALTIMAVGCAAESDDRETVDEIDAIAETTLQSVEDAVADLNSSDGGSQIASMDRKFLGTTGNFWEDLKMDLGRLGALNAATINCGLSSGSGTVDTTRTGNWGTDAIIVTARVFDDCGAVFGKSGTVYLDWSGLSLSSPYVQFNSTLKRAPAVTWQNKVTGRSVVVNGTSAEAINDQKVAQSLRWTSVSGNNRTVEIVLSSTREGRGRRGLTLFRHAISSPDFGQPDVLTVTSLVPSSGTRTRTINGSVTVDHQLANYQATSVFSNLVFDPDTCETISGSINTTVSGEKSGTVVTTFSDETGTYEFTPTGASSPTLTGTITVDRCY